MSQKCQQETCSPEAFGSTFELENAQPLSWFSDRLGGSTVLGAFRNAELVAIAGFAVQQGQKTAHKGMLWGRQNHGAGCL
jgi:hypothetical protein